MKTKTEIERMLITILCAAYDKGVASLGYCSLDDTKRDKWVLERVLSIKEWFMGSTHKHSICDLITHDWLLDRNFDNITDTAYSYKGGGKHFCFMVDNINGKWYADIGGGFANYGSYHVEYGWQIEDLFLLLSGKNIETKRYKKSGW